MMDWGGNYASNVTPRVANTDTGDTTHTLALPRSLDLALLYKNHMRA